MLSELRRQREKYCVVSLTCGTKKKKKSKTYKHRSRMAVIRGWGRGGNRERLFKGYKVQLKGTMTVANNTVLCT